MEEDFKVYFEKYVKSFNIPPAHAIKHRVVREYGKFKGVPDKTMDNIALTIEKENADGKEE